MPRSLHVATLCGSDVAGHLLDPMEANCRLQGFAQREPLRTLVNEFLTKLPK